MEFQSTLPVRGATILSQSWSMSMLHFNPRSPYGERLVWCLFWCSGGYFNPRSPYGERQGWNVYTDMADVFQSTLPVRGATSGPLGAAAATNISIHAPRTGSDALKPPPPAPPLPFQSTLPVRGATKIFLSRHTPRGISIHAPRTGSDRIESNAIQPAKRISIHAPRTGSVD